MAGFRMDLHFHSVHSDGILAPERMVEEAVASAGAAGEVTALALSDHNSYAGCESFLDACARFRVKGYVSSEISGSHPSRPDVEFHFLALLGPNWDDGARGRAGSFTPWFNRLLRTDMENAFMFAEKAERLGVRIPMDELVGVAQRHAGMGDPPIYRHPTFADLRFLLRSVCAPSVDIMDFERQLWNSGGPRPLPTPSVTECYKIMREVEPFLILAHPSIYGLSPAEMNPLLQEWKREIGLLGIEAHYMGNMHVEWRRLAEENGLIVTPGSDSHNGFRPHCLDTSPPAEANPRPSLPVIHDGQTDIHRLIDLLDNA